LAETYLVFLRLSVLKRSCETTKTYEQYKMNNERIQPYFLAWSHTRVTLRNSLHVGKIARRLNQHRERHLQRRSSKPGGQLDSRMAVLLHARLRSDYWWRCRQSAGCGL